MRVLVMRVRISSEFLALQRVLSRLWIKKDEKPVQWHHPQYSAHVTVAWVKSGSQCRCENKVLLQKPHFSILVQQMEIKKFKSPEFCEVRLREANNKNENESKK